MPKKVLIAIADGTEELEAIAVIDILRRAELEVTVAAAKLTVVCSRLVKITADKLIQDIPSSEEFDLVYLPGGLPGTTNLLNDKNLQNILQKHKSDNKYLAAICAAPSILKEHELLEHGKEITSHPSIQDSLSEYVYSLEKVVRSGNIITSRGAGTAIDLALYLVELLCDQEKKEEIAKAIVYSGGK